MMVLNFDHYQTEMATSGVEALAKFDTQPFDMVFTDYFMPGMKGDQLAQAIKIRDQSRPIVLLTGFPPDHQAAEFHSVIIKPFSPQSLRQAVLVALHLDRGG